MQQAAARLSLSSSWSRATLLVLGVVVSTGTWELRYQPGHSLVITVSGLSNKSCACSDLFLPVKPLKS